ncbi:S1C family serine protease [Saccharibacillus sp. JS10]|uniref:S1C family serine protease n=1 Tax=Saccharibacillus sp. JS10 TaxID=2950552 RepID=UPI00210C3B06|nr:S1C family serine protease [Saccharibacillus sp. JS10]MCQ4088757.1 S1C family serine protease [Saccharibacillus sp. JS10]
MKKSSKKAAYMLLSGVIGLGSLGIMPVSEAQAATVKSSQSTPKTIPQIIAQVSPSVVGIVGQVPADYMDEWADAENSEDGTQFAHGSGVVIRSNGWIVTNAHVVDQMENMRVVTSEGKTYPVREVYSDSLSDIALIRINVTGFKPARFVSATTKTRVGDPVIAIGTPVSLTLRNSATTGIISGLNRAAGAAYRLIQTDATINPGNSGGPLINMRGEILGINSMKIAAVDIDNTGFTIPADTVQYVLKQLFEQGEVIRAGLGVELEESLAASAGLPSDDPLTVMDVYTNRAKKAGIQEGDLLYSVAGHRIHTVIELNELMKKYKPGQTVRVFMQSGGDIVERKLVLSKE